MIVSDTQAFIYLQILSIYNQLIRSRRNRRFDSSRGHDRLLGEQLGGFLFELGSVAVSGGAEAVAVYIVMKIMKRAYKEIDKQYRICEQAAEWGTTVVNKMVPDPILRAVSV